MTREGFLASVRRAVPNLSEESAQAIMEEMKSADQLAGKKYSDRDAQLVEMAVKRRRMQQLSGIVPEIMGKRLGLVTSGIKHDTFGSRCYVTGKRPLPNATCECRCCEFSRFRGYCYVAGTSAPNGACQCKGCLLAATY